MKTRLSIGVKLYGHLHSWSMVPYRVYMERAVW